MQDDTLRQAFFRIARCPNVKRCLDGDTRHPCFDIVSSQKASSPERFQLPEPWVGRINVAPVLFVASNPSIGEDTHALLESDEEAVWESQHFAFGGGSRRYIINGIKTTDAAGRPLKTVRYWSSIRSRARELIADAEPGLDYAMTEVVHCKSTSEIGVAKAYRTCVSAHLGDIFAVSPAVVVIAMGRYAMKALGVEPGDGVKQLTLGGRVREITALHHPASFSGPKTLRAALGQDKLNSLRRTIAVVRSIR